MKILIVSSADVSNYIGASLIDRGHEVTWITGDVRVGYLDSVMNHDGCLLLRDDNSIYEELAQKFKDCGKKVWREWTDIPPTKEWPKGGFLASKH